VCVFLFLQIINIVSQQLNIPAVTTGNAIVSGNDAHLTNTLLQQFSLCILSFCVQLGIGLKGQTSSQQQQQSDGMLSGSPSTVDVKPSANAHDRHEQRERVREHKCICHSFLRQCEVTLYDDADNVLWSQRVNTALQDIDDTFEVVIPSDVTSSSSSILCSRLTIQPLDWVNVALPTVVGLRLEVLGIDNQNALLQSLPVVWNDEQFLQRIERVQQVLQQFISIVQEINAVEQAEKTKRQEDMKKVSLVTLAPSLSLSVCLSLHTFLLLIPFSNSTWRRWQRKRLNWHSRWPPKRMPC
jgi:hypothetical protein